MLTARLERFTGMVAGIAIQRFKEKLENMEEKNEKLKELIENLESEIMKSVIENESLKKRIEIMSCHTCGN